MKNPIWFFAIFLLLYSCHKEPDCSEYELTAKEILSVPYNVGDKAVFKNDFTAEYDTMTITAKNFRINNPPQLCSYSKGLLEVIFGFIKLAPGSILVYHSKNENLTIRYDYGKSHSFILSGTLQSINVNGIGYNDVYTVAIDSASIGSGHKEKLPWKIDFSKSKGFVRFYIQNYTWSKL